MLNDDYVIKPLPKELKVVLNVDSADGALIGGDSDDPQSEAAGKSFNASATTFASTDSPSASDPDLTIHFSKSQANLSTAFPGVNMSDTSAHYHIVYKRALSSSSSPSKLHHSSRTDLSEDGYLMSETDNIASLTMPDHDYGTNMTPPKHCRKIEELAHAFHCFERDATRRDSFHFACFLRCVRGLLHSHVTPLLPIREIC